MSLLIYMIGVLELLSLFMPFALIALVAYGSIGCLYTVSASYKLAGRKKWRASLKAIFSVILAIALVMQTHSMYLQASGLLIASFLSFGAVEALTFRLTKPRTYKRHLLEMLLKLAFYWPMKLAWLVILAEIFLRLAFPESEPPSVLAYYAP